MKIRRKEEGGTSTGWGDNMEEEEGREEIIAESGEWTEVVSRRVREEENVKKWGGKDE